MTIAQPIVPRSEAEVLSAVQDSSDLLVPHGAGTKSGLIPAAEMFDRPVIMVDCRQISGITVYNPSEFTFTARAGTTLAEISAALAEHGQSLPFDPPLVDAGATLGGAIAAGLSGPGRVRFGGLRDFLLGVTFVDGNGDLVHGGGKVVKNAAGLDLARLMVGSIGRLGIITEATFKVFPSPPAFATLRIPVESTTAGSDLLLRLSSMPLEYSGLEFVPDEPALYARLGGLESVLPARMAHLTHSFGGELLSPEHEATFWRNARELAWAPDHGLLVRIAITPQQIGNWESAQAMAGGIRRYSAGGHILWFASSERSVPIDLARFLNERGTTGLVVRGQATHPILGKRSGQPFLASLRSVFDPHRRFLDL